MIECYTGFVGSGKSYAATYRGVYFAEAPLGGTVVANFPIKPKAKNFLIRTIEKFRKKEFKSRLRWFYWENDWFTPSKLIDFSLANGWNKKEGSALLIFDEAGIMFNSRDWNINPNERKEWIKFFSQSRKFGYDIVFIAQDIRMIDRQIRGLIEYEVQHKKMNNWLIFKLLPFTLFAQVSFWNGIRNFRGSLKIVPYRKKIGDRYDTLGIFGYEESLKGGE